MAQDETIGANRRFWSRFFHLPIGQPIPFPFSTIQNGYPKEDRWFSDLGHTGEPLFWVDHRECWLSHTDISEQAGSLPSCNRGTGNSAWWLSFVLLQLAVFPTKPPLSNPDGWGKNHKIRNETNRITKNLALQEELAPSRHAQGVFDLPWEFLLRTFLLCRLKALHGGRVSPSLSFKT